MTQATIEIGNVTSRLYADPETIATVRHFVAYQERPLPPPAVQGAIKHYYDHHRRYGGLADLLNVGTDALVLRTAAETGFDLRDLTVSMLETTLAQKGAWDGWKRMVTDSGYFLTGLLRYVERALELRAGVRYRLVDLRGDPPPATPWAVQIPLYPFQQEAADAFLRAGRGVLDLPPRSGKTRVGIFIVCRLGVPTVWIAPNIGIANQTHAAFLEFLPEAWVACVTGGKPSAARQRQLLRTPVWIATPMTAAKLLGIKGRHLLVLDEFHHTAAATWQAVSKAASAAWWRLGMTGTHFRADGRDMEMAGVLGRAVYRKTVGEMVALGRLVPARVAMLRVRGGDVSGTDWYAGGVVDHQGRNAIVAWAAQQLTARGKRVLVLAKEVRHTKALAGAIPGAVAVDGEDHDAVEKALRDLAAGTVPVVVGTSVIGEGRDVPVADALVYAPGGRSRVKVTQDYFRVLTQSPGKRVGIVVDCADTHGATLSEHAAARLMLYRSEPAFQADVMEWQEFPAWLDAVVGG